MDTKKIRTGFSRISGWFGLTVSSLITKIIPSTCLYGFARGIAFLGYRFASKQRNIAMDSLSIAFGSERTRQEREKIAQDCFTLMAKSAIELLFLMDRPELLKKRVSLEGKKNLDDALKAGRGVILVSAHFGNFPLLMAKLSLEGYKTAGIMRAMRDTRVESMFLKKRSRLGIKTIYSQPRNTCVNTTIESLRNNELVFIPIDQNFGTSGVFVNFFGTKAATATGPVVLAQRTGAKLLPCFIIRNPDDTHRLIFESEIGLVQGKDAQETVLINIQKLTGVIESYIRNYPAEWGWIHRRWKSKPSEKGGG